MEVMSRLAKHLLIAYVTALFLTSCVNYKGIHPQDQLLNQQTLIEKQTSITRSSQKAQQSQSAQQSPIAQQNNNENTTSLIPQWTNNTWWECFHDLILNQIIAQSLTNHPDIQLAEARVRLATQLAKQAEANSGATLIGAGYGEKQRYSGDAIYPPPIGGVWFNFGDLETDFNYDFDFWHKNQQTIAAAMGNEQAAKANEENAKLVLSTAIAKTYFQILGDNTLISLAQKNLADQLALTKLIALQAHSGIISTFPVQQANQTVASAQIAVTQLINARQISIDQLNALVITPISMPPIQHKLTLNNSIQPLPNTIPLNLLASRPDLMVLRWSVEADRHQIKAAKAAFYPDINLMGALGLQSIGFEKLFNSNSYFANIGPAFNLPIFDAGRLRASLGVSDAQYDIAVDQYNQGLLNAIQQTADALTQLQSVITQEMEQTALLLATQKNDAYVSARYRAGTTDALDYLRTEQTVLQQQQQSAQLQVQHLLAEINLIQALGGGYNQSQDFTHA